jgi:hypothetical protein
MIGSHGCVYEKYTSKRCQVSDGRSGKSTIVPDVLLAPCDGLRIDSKPLGWMILFSSIFDGGGEFWNLVGCLISKALSTQPWLVSLLNAWAEWSRPSTSVSSFSVGTFGGSIRLLLPSKLGSWDESSRSSSREICDFLQISTNASELLSSFHMLSGDSWPVF